MGKAIVVCIPEKAFIGILLLSARPAAVCRLAQKQPQTVINALLLFELKVKLAPTGKATKMKRFSNKIRVRFFSLLFSSRAIETSQPGRLPLATVGFYLAASTWLPPPGCRIVGGMCVCVFASLAQPIIHLSLSQVTQFVH